MDLRVNTVRIISDTLEDIIKTVREESDRSTYVFTTGGVGPTHDDVTMEAIATVLEHPPIGILDWPTILRQNGC